MKELDDFVHQHLDQSNFPPLIADVGKAALKHAGLESTIDTAQRAQIERMRAYARVHPNDPLVKANLDLLPDANAESWTAGGNCDFTSFIWWAIGGGIAFPGLIPLGFLFGGKGKDWAAWATFVSVVAGSFVVDPKKIALSPEFKLEKTPIGWVRKGPARFSLTMAGAGPAGGISMSFSSIDGTYWGLLTGYAPAIGYVGINGECKLVWQGF